MAVRVPAVNRPWFAQTPLGRPQWPSPLKELTAFHQGNPPAQMSIQTKMMCAHQWRDVADRQTDPLITDHRYGLVGATRISVANQLLAELINS